MAEIFYNEKINNYTLDEEKQGVKSIKKVPMKFKLEDTTSKYRKEILKKEIFGE
ncbi:MAG: hypothetical protein KC550_00855 [Nanoarchaeota archaeon]|nr:hypothetical protein [Nanoarchaeota archaeon]